MMWPFKWKLSACTFTWCYLFFKISQSEISKFGRNLLLAKFGSEKLKIQHNVNCAHDARSEWSLIAANFAKKNEWVTYLHIIGVPSKICYYSSRIHELKFLPFNESYTRWIGKFVIFDCPPASIAQDISSQPSKTQSPLTVHGASSTRPLPLRFKISLGYTFVRILSFETSTTARTHLFKTSIVINRGNFFFCISKMSVKIFDAKKKNKLLKWLSSVSCFGLAHHPIPCVSEVFLSRLAPSGMFRSRTWNPETIRERDGTLSREMSQRQQAMTSGFRRMQNETRNCAWKIYGI